MAQNLIGNVSQECRKSVFHQFRSACVELQEGRHASAVRIALEVAQKWPLDPAPFNNAIESLMKLEKWDEAQRLFDLAPGSFQLLKYYDLRKTQLEERDIYAGRRPPVDPFYGQPDLGGVLKAESTGI